MATTHGRNGIVALKVCGAGAVVTGAWCAWGFWLHNKVMDQANAFERQIAEEINLDVQQKRALFAFDRAHPNNAEYFAMKDAKEGTSREGR